MLYNITDVVMSYNICCITLHLTYVVEHNVCYITYLV